MTAIAQVHQGDHVKNLDDALGSADAYFMFGLILPKMCFQSN